MTAFAVSSGTRGIAGRDARAGSRRPHRRIPALLAALGLVLSMSLTAGAAEESDPFFDDIFDEEYDAGPTSYPDPAEGVNRGIFAFNRQLDRWILDPVTRAYRFVVPKPMRLALARVFVNLGSTKTLVNDFLQLEWQDAGVTTSRLLINSTLGVVGLFDVAAKMGLEGHSSDFGQTLALAGVPSGPYLVIPILGPSNIRDGTGTIIDGFFQPTYYIIGPADLLIGPTEILIYSGSSGISTRDQHFLALKALEDSSVDFYATLRSGFYQQRIDEIWGRRDGHRTTEEPEYGDRDEAEDDSDVEASGEEGAGEERSDEEGSGEEGSGEGETDENPDRDSEDGMSEDEAVAASGDAL